MFDPIEFGKRMQKARTLQGLTQEQLAEVLNVSRNQVARIERGFRACSIDFLVELATVLNTTTDFLLTGTEPIPVIKERLNDAIKQMQFIVDTL